MSDVNSWYGYSRRMNFIVHFILLGQHCLRYYGGVVSFDEQKAEARRGLFRDIVLL